MLLVALSGIGGSTGAQVFVGGAFNSSLFGPFPEPRNISDPRMESSGAAIDMMERTLVGMVKAGHKGTQLDDFVNFVTPYLTEMETRIQNTSERAQVLLDVIDKRLKACSEESDHSNTQIQEFQKAVKAKRAIHATCRGVEKNNKESFDKCQANEETK